MSHVARAQSETVGVVLLVGVFAVAATSIGVAIIGSVADEAEDSPNVDVNVSTDQDNVTITHGGGDVVDLSDVKVILRDGSGAESRYDLAAAEFRRGSDDDTFDPGDGYREGHDFGTGDLRVTIVDTETNTVLADETLRVREPSTPSGPLTAALTAL